MKSVEVRQLYETLLCSPGMNEQVRIDMRISRKTILLLSQMAGRTLASTGTDGNPGMLALADKESREELKEVIKNCLEKATLSTLDEKLSLLDHDQKN